MVLKGVVHTSTLDYLETGNASLGLRVSTAKSLTLILVTYLRYDKKKKNMPFLPMLELTKDQLYRVQAAKSFLFPFSFSNRDVLPTRKVSERQSQGISFLAFREIECA